MIEEQNSKSTIPDLTRELLHLPFHQVVPSDTNPRLNLDKEPFEELKKSIDANGLLQPIVVRPKGDVYEIIGGHRRYHAFQQLAAAKPKDKRFSRIPAVVVDVDDDMVPVLQLAENLNRSDLSPIEIADGVARAVRSGVDPKRLAENLGWTRRSLNRYMQLADAPAWLREFAKEVKNQKRKLDEKGATVFDPKTNRPVFEVERYPGLGFSDLYELIGLFNVLREADALQLEENGGEKFRPQAERVTKRLAVACAAEGWSNLRLRAEIKRVKDPPPQPQRRSDARAAVVIGKDRCVLDLRRAQELTAAERKELATKLTEALGAYGFKSVLITP